MSTIGMHVRADIDQTQYQCSPTLMRLRVQVSHQSVMTDVALYLQRWTVSTVRSQAQFSICLHGAHQNSPTEAGSHFSLAGIPGMDSSIPLNVPVAPEKWLGE